MYRRVFKQKGPVCLLRMTDEKAQDLQGVIQDSSVTHFWQMLLLREEAGDCSFGVHFC